MKLSIYSNFFADLPLEDALSKISESGFRYSELDAPIPFKDAKGSLSVMVSRLRKHCEKIGINLIQAHGYWGEFLKPSSLEWKKRISLFKKEIQVAGDLGVQCIVAHPMLKSNIESMYPAAPLDSLKIVFEHNVKFFSELIPVLEGNKVKIAIENMPSLREGFTTIDELLELVETLHSDSFGICLDTGHLNQASGDFARFIYKAGTRLIATHIHDCLNLPDRDLHLFPLFSSYDSWINWTLVMNVLSEIRYGGTYNLETPGEGPTAGVPLWMRERKLKFIFDCLSEFIRRSEKKSLPIPSQDENLRDDEFATTL